MSIPKESDVIGLEIDDQTSCTIHLFGATLISWICEGDELIFVSSKAKFDNKSAIRGGVPIVFPNFGPWSQGPQHGFARISRWLVEQFPQKDDCGNVSAVLSLEDSEETRAMWNNHRFKVTLTVTLSRRLLKMRLLVLNKGDSTMSFTCLLHTYFRLPDVSLASVSNLRGLSYIDKARKSEAFIEKHDPLRIDGFIDSIYQNTPNQHTISGLASGKTVNLEKVNLPDTVIWNPWEKALHMDDLGDDYMHMICVEAGNVSTAIELQPKITFEASQTLSII